MGGRTFLPRPCDEVDSVGEESVVPKDARGRPNLLPTAGPFLPAGVGVAYILNADVTQRGKGVYGCL